MAQSSTMSKSLVGMESTRWSLARAVDALAAAARQAARPGAVWVAGVFYPSVTLGLFVGWDGVLSLAPMREALLQFSRIGRQVMDDAAVAAPSVSTEFSDLLTFFPCVGIFLIPVYRLVAGLARVAPDGAWSAACAGRRTPSLRAIWRAGDGLTLATFGLWFQLAIMMLGATLFLAVPVVVVARFFVESSTTQEPWLPIALRILFGGTVLGPLVLVMVLYTLAVSVLAQLSIHSLAHNRRGVGSALLHGWRIMRHDGWATARAVLVDVLLFLLLCLVWLVVDRLLLDLPVREWMSTTLRFVMIGFLGAARAGYWARAYRALGGLSPDDHVPGLEAPAASPA